MTAYEELKAWCEKHFKAGEYMAEKDNGEGYPHIDLYLFSHCEITVWFKPNEEYDFIEVFD